MLSSVIQQSGQGPGVPGVPQLVAKFDATAQAANIAQTQLYVVPAGQGGTYRLSGYAVVTQAATTSSTLPALQVFWNDADTNFLALAQFSNTPTGNTVGLTSAQSGNASGTVAFQAKAGGTIFYATTGYASSGATPMQYALHVKLEYLGA